LDGKKVNNQRPRAQKRRHPCPPSAETCGIASEIALRPEVFPACVTNPQAVPLQQFHDILLHIALSRCLYPLSLPPFRFSTSCVDSTCTHLMPESGFGYNAAKITPSDNPQRSSKMISAPITATSSRLPGDSVRYPPEDGTVATKKHPQKRKLEKNSWEYIIKSGAAGGFAGCAVGDLTVT